MKSITSISHLRWLSPLWCLTAPKGENAFSSPAGRLYGFGRQRRYKKWRRRRRTSPAGTVSQPIGKPFNGQAKGLLWLTWRSYAGPPQYYITPEGESPQPVREASAGPGQNPGSPGPKGPAAGSPLTPVRACQPSGIQGSTAPPTGIYREMIHYRRIPRSFVSLRMTSGRRGSPATSHQQPSSPSPFTIPLIPIILNK